MDLAVMNTADWALQKWTAQTYDDGGHADSREYNQEKCACGANVTVCHNSSQESPAHCSKLLVNANPVGVAVLSTRKMIVSLTSSSDVK